MKSKKNAGIFFILVLLCVCLSACQLMTFPEATAENEPSATQAVQISEAPSPQATATSAQTPQAAETAQPQETVPDKKAADMGVHAYQYLKTIDSLMPDRDCVYGADYAKAQEWLVDELEKAGYAADTIHIDDFTFPEDGNDIKAKNISVTKAGTSGKQIIIGAHYDGTGACDNGSGISLTLAAAAEFFDKETYYDLTFIFFSGEEYGMYGSYAYAGAMSEEDIARTEYMINLDCLISGDFCYVYGGVADYENATVTATEAVENALETADALGLNIRTNPWTFDDPEPTAPGGYPAYPSPTTGDWSDHVGFRDAGIQYVYCEATNWDIGTYDGYDETAEFGPVIHTEKDNLTTIEEMFPGRALDRLTTYSLLLYELFRQNELAF